jgi:hypothetical protein
MKAMNPLRSLYCIRLTERNVVFIKRSEPCRILGTRLLPLKFWVATCGNRDVGDRPRMIHGAVSVALRSDTPWASELKSSAG